jgi:thiamine biosynthesis protein ThiI
MDAVTTTTRNPGLLMPEPRFDTVIVRFGGEIGIKAEWTRKLYERRLTANIKAVLKEHSISQAHFVRRFGRLYIKTDQAEKTAESLRKVFGISSLSPSLETNSNLDNILNTSLNLTTSEFKKGKTFGVNCHRVGKHPYTSQEVCRKVGQAVLDQLPELKLRVDLTHPDQTLHIEIRDDKAYMFINIVRAEGGLPLGTQPRLVNLLKGDIASAVACWMTMKRGCPPVLVHFENATSKRAVSLSEVIETAKRLLEWSTGFPRRLYLITGPQTFEKSIQKQSTALSDLILKRLMLKVAVDIAKMKNAEGIVTGNIIQEQAEQELHTFRLQDETVKGYPVYRPLIGLTAPEIQEAAHTIGLPETFTRQKRSKAGREKIQEESINLEDIKKIESEINVEQVAEETLKSLTVLKI